MDEDEKRVLDKLTDTLSFDPTIEAHRLRATTLQDPERIRNVKVVLDELTKGDSDRECQCWQVTPLGVLQERGTHTGLTDYMNEVQARF